MPETMKGPRQIELDSTTDNDKNVIITETRY